MILLPAIHMILGILLTVSHTLFLYRGFLFLRTDAIPKAFDKVARFSAQFSLPLSVATGIMLLLKKNAAFFPHGLLGLIPMCLIPLNALLRIIIKKRRSLPWLLPSVNFFFVIGAMITGFLLQVS